MKKDKLFAIISISAAILAYPILSLKEKFEKETEAIKLELQLKKLNEERQKKVLLDSINHVKDSILMDKMSDSLLSCRGYQLVNGFYLGMPVKEYNKKLHDLKGRNYNATILIDDTPFYIDELESKFKNGKLEQLCLASYAEELQYYDKSKKKYEKEYSDLWDICHKAESYIERLYGAKNPTYGWKFKHIEIYVYPDKFHKRDEARWVIEYQVRVKIKFQYP